MSSAAVVTPSRLALQSVSSAALPNLLSGVRSWWDAVVDAVQRFFGQVGAIWHSWPGRLTRWAVGAVILSTIVLNSLVVPYCNARVLPRVEAAAAVATGREVTLEGIRWVSPPGLVGMGPVASLNCVYVGPRAAECSEAFVPQTSVSVAPVQSILQRRIVLNLELQQADVVVRQADNYSWFGYPIDTVPSARDFLPGADAAGGASRPAGSLSGGGGAAAAPVDDGYDAVSWSWGYEQAQSDAIAASGDAATGGRVGETTHPTPSTSAPSAPARLPGEAPGGVELRPPRRATKTSLPLASVGGAAQQRSDPLVAVHDVAVVDGRLHAYVVGDPCPRRLADVDGLVRLGRDYHTVDVDVRAAAFARDPDGMRCTMPCNPGARNLRALTPGGEIARINDYAVTRQGPSPASLQKMALRQVERLNELGRRGAPGAVLSLPQPAVAAESSVGPPTAAPSLHRELFAPRASERFAPDAADVAAAPTAAAPDGGRLRVRVAASDVGRDGVWPACTVTIDGDELQAPLLDRLVEIPMDIYGGRLNGTLELHLHDDATWREFPNFAGRVQVSDAAFHFWDSPDDFSRTDMTLLFEKDRLYLHNARGWYGALDMTAGGDVGLNPDTGQYSIQAKVEAVDINALRATLGARPLPYPVAGAVGGSMQCYGPLEYPVFTGSVETRALPPTARALADHTDAFYALQDAVAEGRAADLAYDRVPFSNVRGIFSMDTRTGQVSVQSVVGQPLEGGVLKGSGRMCVDPAAERDPAAIRFEFTGEGLSPSMALPYAPGLQDSTRLTSTLGPFSANGYMAGSHADPTIKSSFKLLQVQSDGIVELTRQHATLKLKAPAIDVAATVRTELPSFEAQKTALTQEAAIAMREPRIRGSSVHADVRNLDVLPLLQSLPGDVLTPGQSMLGRAGLEPTRLQVNGHLRMSAHAVETPRHTVLQFDGAQAGWQAEDAGERPPASEFVGKMGLSSFRVNQLQLAKSIEGSFTLRNDRFDMRASGLRYNEKLAVSVQLPSAQGAPAGPAADVAGEAYAPDQLRDASGAAQPAAAASRPAGEELPAPDRGSARAANGREEFDESAAPGQGSMTSSVELRSGHLIVRGQVNRDMTQASVKVANLPLDDLELSSLRGVVKDLDVAVDLDSLSGHGKLVVHEPRYEGLRGQRLNAEVHARNGVAHLDNTFLEQDASRFVIEGGYTLLQQPAATPPEPAAPVAGPSDSAAAALTADSSAAATRHEASGDAAADAAQAVPDSNGHPNNGASVAREPTAAIEPAPAPQQTAADALADAPDAGDAVADADADLAAVQQDAAALEANERAAEVEPASKEGAAWWLTVKADAQLDDIMPATQLVTRQSDSPVDGVKAKAVFMQSVRESVWTLGEPAAPVALEGGAKRGGRLSSGGSLPALSSLTGHVSGEFTAFGSEQGATCVKFNGSGSDWQWGRYRMDRMSVLGDLDSKKGLQLEELQVDAEGAQLSMRGTLLGAEQDATVKLDDFPLDLLEPLVQVALPNLHAPRQHDSLSQLGPVTRPLYAVQRQLRRAAEALPFQSAAGRVAGAPPSTSPISGKLFLTGSIAGPVDAPRATVGVRLEDAALGALPLSEAGASALLSGDGTARVSSKLVPAGQSGSLAVSSTFRVPHLDNLDASVEVRDAGMAILTELGGDALAWQEGKAVVSLRATGSAAAPHVTGKAQVSKARVTSPMLKTPFTGLTSSMTLKDGQLSIHHLNARSGRNGELHVAGSLPLVPSPAKASSGRIVVDVRELEVRSGAAAVAPSYSGELLSQLTIRGSLQRPVVAGELKLSRGMITVGGMAPPASAAQPQLPAAADERVHTSKIFATLKDSRRGAAALQAQSSARLPALEDLGGSLRSSAPDATEAVTLDKLNIILGPELRIGVPILVQVDLSGAVQLDGPATPQDIVTSGEVRLDSGVFNVLATQFNVDRGHKNVVTFPGEPGVNPIVDVALVSGNFRISCLGRLDEAANNITFTGTGDAKPQSMGSSEAAVVLEEQLKSLILQDDGQLALENLAFNAVSTLLPKIEGHGQIGKARFRLVGTPTVPFFDSSRNTEVWALGARGDLEVMYGDKLKATLSSRHLADARLSATYQVAPKLRVYAASSTPRASLTVMLQYTDSSSSSLENGLL